MQWVLWQGGFKNRVEGRELANHLLVGCIKHYQLYLLSTGFLNHQPQYNCAAYWATKEGGKKRIWNQLNSHEISSFLLPCFYCSRIMYISIVSSDISDTMDINVFENFPRSSQPPLFSHVKTEAPSFALDPPWRITSVPVFALQVPKGGKLLGPSESVSTTVFQLWNLGTGVTHLFLRLFVGVISYHHICNPYFEKGIFGTKTRKDRWYFLGVFLPGLPGSLSFLFESPICSICCILQWPHVKTRWTWRVKDVLDES